MYSTGNCIQHPVINHNGKEYEKEYIYILNHFVVHQKLTQHCKSTILQFKKIFYCQKKNGAEYGVYCKKKTGWFQSLWNDVYSAQDGAARRPTVLLQMVNIEKAFIASKAYFPCQHFQVIRAVWNVLTFLFLRVVLTLGLSKIKPGPSWERGEAGTGEGGCGVSHHCLSRAGCWPAGGCQELLLFA